MSKQETIFNTDDYRIFDALAHKRKITGGLIGWVQAYKNPIFKNNKPVPGTGELLYDNHNLILASGRNIVAYKMFDQADALELKTYKVSHFGVGAGGEETAVEHAKSVSLCHKGHVLCCKRCTHLISATDYNYKRCFLKKEIIIYLHVFKKWYYLTSQLDYIGKHFHCNCFALSFLIS